MGALPVAPNVEVVEHRTYVHTAKRWVALCVVHNEFGFGLKFYKWICRHYDDEWKVDLARFSVGDIDICRMASDAIELAGRYGIKLDWPTLDQIAGVDVSVQSTPECPSCHGRSQVVGLETVTTWHCTRCDETWDTASE